MSTDGDFSKGSGTDEGPDEFDSVVLDESFIRGGISEASLRRYQVVSEQKWQRPAARPAPPGSSADGAATGGPSAGISSWATDLPQDGARASRRSGPNGHGGSSGVGPNPGTGGFEHKRPRALGIVLGVAALVVALIVLTGLMGLGRGSAGSAGTGNLPVASQPGAGAGAGQKVPLSTSVPPGSCFDVPADSTAKNLTITIVSCATTHQYELIDLQQGTGNNDQYPTQATWKTTVNNQCSDDLQTYTGESSKNWPTSLFYVVIPPTQAAWSQGDRTIYCVAGQQGGTTGSVRGIGLTAAAPTH